MKKNEILKGTVVRIDYPNKGIVRVDGVFDADGHLSDVSAEAPVLVKRVLPGQEIRLRLKKKRRGQWEGECQEILKPGPGHCDHDCSKAGTCGGCAYQGLQYEAQLRLKEEQVLRLLETVMPEDRAIPWEGIRPSPSPAAYRNKMEFTFGDEYLGGPLALGLHKRSAFHDIVTADGCRICDPDFGQIVQSTRDYFAAAGTPFYHRMRHTGYLRHLLVRKGEKTGEILVDLVTAGAEQLAQETDIPQPDERSLLTGFCQALTALETEGRLRGHFTGILHTINNRLGDVIADEGTEILYGTDHLTDQVLGLSFKISPFSFFQTNTGGAEILYQAVRDYMGDVSGKNVYDLYSGTGTIAQILAPSADHVTGVEIVPEAVEAAKDNAAANGLSNCEFLCGDVFEVLDRRTEADRAPDVIVLDPPREGVRQKALNRILSYGADRIVYVSCQITSLVRDLPVFFDRGYQLSRVSSVDMFPFTTGVETVVLLNNKFVKAKDFVQIGIDAEDYYRIKDSEKDTDE